MRRIILFIITTLAAAQMSAQTDIRLDSVTFDVEIERCPEHKVPDTFGIGPVVYVQFSMTDTTDRTCRFGRNRIEHLQIHWCRDGMTYTSSDLSGQTAVPGTTAYKGRTTYRISTRLPLYPDIINIGGEQVCDSREAIQDVAPTISVSFVLDGKLIILEN